MEKRYCDECGKEIPKGYLYYFWGATYRLVVDRDDGDFCSKKCLKKYVNENL